MRNFITSIYVIRYYWVHQLKESEHVALMGEMRNAYKFFFLENLKGRDLSEGLGTEEKILLK
jgi:hypothetical protein